MSGECCAHLCVCPGTALSYNEQRAGPCTLLHSLHCHVHYCTLLYSATLYFTLLHCALLCVQCCSAVQWAVGCWRQEKARERGEETIAGGWSSALYCTVLELCTVLHCTVLELCTALHNRNLHCTVLLCTSMKFSTLHFTALWYSALHCDVVHCTVLQCT